jgi:lambda family phage portal protein
MNQGDSVEADTGRYIGDNDQERSRTSQLNRREPVEVPRPAVRRAHETILRGISSGLGVSFASISNDLTEVNFSSIRAGLIEERETWKTIQSWFIETFLNRVYSEWLNMALLTGALNLPSVKYNKFNNPKWTGRRWAWVDPLKDVDANKAERAAGFKSATMIANEAGRDYEDILQEIRLNGEL